MEEVDITEQIDKEVQGLQEKLKDRLKEAEDLSELNKQVSQSTFSLEQHTSSLKESAYKTKWKIMMEYYKYIIIIAAIAMLLMFILFKR